MNSDTRPFSISSHSPNADSSRFYESYEKWKGWDNLFAVSEEEKAYFSGETRGLRVANAEILEIGFGAGSFIAWAEQKGAKVAGTEINDTLIDAARQRNVELLDPIIETAADANAERFDTIIAFDVFEHFSLADVSTRLRAAETMLKPGGHLLMRFPNAQSPFGLAPQNGDPTHLSALSRSSIEQLMQGTAFKTVRYTGSFRTAGRGVLQRLVRWFRYCARNVLASVLNFVFARRNMPWDPVVVLVLRKS